MSTISPELKATNHRDNRLLRKRSRQEGRAAKHTIVARTNVGIEEREWHWICDLAHQTDCTISEVIREILREAYDNCMRECV